MVFTDIDASYGNRTIRYVIKTADQVDKAGFCTSGTADDPYGLAGADREIDILQNGFLTVFLIAEIYMIEDDTSRWRSPNAPRRTCITRCSRTPSRWSRSARW